MRNVVLTLLLVSGLGCESAGVTAGEAPSFPADRPNAETSEVVAVDWLGRGRLYAGRITGRRGELTGIVYADGDREWVEEGRLRPWPRLVGQRAQIWARSSARTVEILEERHGLYHVRFEDGADTWASRDMFYALSAQAPPPPPPPSSFPPRGPDLEATPSVGDRVLAFWISGGELQRTRPWLAQVTATAENRQLHLTYSDGSEADVPRAAILRVFSRERARVAVGGRVWVAGARPVGTIIDERSGLVKVRSGSDERWVEVEDVIGDATPIEVSRLARGVFVTALWNGTTLYHATVVGVDGTQVTLAWHDGSTPSAVPVEDVVELWQPR